MNGEIRKADKALGELVAEAAPALLELPGVSIEVAGQLLVTAATTRAAYDPTAPSLIYVVSLHCQQAPAAPTETGSTRQ
ncbi:hypothetical protein ACQP00_20115 [Dactylosporangium sp. CS-047395]|uniref:hypothetical protein n=1 Tax=Dactylosporangium sp. CS-047395 TaxID=3239936 RepID=UPI003D907A71